MNTDESPEAHNLGQPSFNKITYKESLVRQLNKILKEQGLVSKPDSQKYSTHPLCICCWPTDRTGWLPESGWLKTGFGEGCSQFRTCYKYGRYWSSRTATDYD